MSHPVQQIRLASGEEVLCEVMEYDTDGDEIIVRNAMAVETNMFENNERVYMFRPWFLYIEQPHENIMIKTNQVIGNCEPNELLRMQYYSAVKDMQDIAESRIDDFKRREAMKLKSTLEAITRAKTKNEEEVESTLPSNVIQFPYDDDGTIH